MDVIPIAPFWNAVKLFLRVEIPDSIAPKVAVIVDPVALLKDVNVLVVATITLLNFGNLELKIPTASAFQFMVPRSAFPYFLDLIF